MDINLDAQLVLYPVGESAVKGRLREDMYWEWSV